MTTETRCLKKAYRDSRTALPFKQWATVQAERDLIQDSINASDEYAKRDILAARAWLRAKGGR